MSYHNFVKKYQIDYLGLQQTYFGEDLARVKQEDVTTTANVHQIFKKDKDYINPSETATGYIEKDGKLVVAPAISSSSMKGFLIYGLLPKMSAIGTSALPEVY